MTAATKRTIFRWIHILFGLPILGYNYGPAEEVAQYAPMFRYIFVPVLVFSGFWMWKGDAILRLVFRKSA